MGNETRLSDVSTCITKGTTPTTIGGRFTDYGISFVKVESISENGRIIPEKLAFIDAETNSILSRSMLEADDILFTIAGTIGRVALVKSNILPANTNQAVAIIRPDKTKVDCRFLYYVLKNPKIVVHAETRTVQSVQANFSLKELRRIQFPGMDRKKQRAIARVLGALDDKIELLRSLNETLEAMARALFKSWFVDFDPVRGKAEGKPTGLPPEIDSLFPDSFEDSELGEIPKGWGKTNIGALFSHVIGGDWGKENLEEGFSTNVRVIRGTDMDKLRFGIPFDLPNRFIKRGSIDKRQINAGDIVLEISGGSPTQPTGRTVFFTESLVKQYALPLIPASFCRLIRPITKEIGIYIKEHLRYLYDIDGTWLYQNQSTGISNFQFETFSTKEVVAFPSTNIVTIFSTIISRYDSIRINNNIEASNLSTMRDTLLPRLISGDLELSDDMISKILEKPT